MGNELNETMKYSCSNGDARLKKVSDSSFSNKPLNSGAKMKYPSSVHGKDAGVIVRNSSCETPFKDRNSSISAAQKKRLPLKKSGSQGDNRQPPHFTGTY